MPDSNVLDTQREWAAGELEDARSWIGQVRGFLSRASDEAEQKVRHCLRSRDRLAEIRRVMREHPWAVEPEQLEQISRSMREFFDTTMALFESVQELTDQLRGAGRPIEGAELLPQAAAEMRSQRDQFLAAWPVAGQARPPLNREMVQKAREQIGRGEYRNVKDLIDELRGGGVQLPD